MPFYASNGRERRRAEEMSKYRFQIQSCIDVEVEADNEIEARIDIVDHINRYADQLSQDPYVSDGELIK